MKQPMPLIRFLLAAAWISACIAAAPAALSGEAVPDNLQPLPPPPVLEDGTEVPEPDIRIIRRDDSVIEEYRLNGQLYAIKITPVVGPPYYLIDHDGDGMMDGRIHGQERVRVPEWVIFSW